MHIKKLLIALFFVFLSLPFADRARAGERVFMCPDLASAEQAGTCPTEQELKTGYDATCPSVLAKRKECKPYQAYVKMHAKSLWAVISNGEEFLPYISCATKPEVVKSSRVQSVGVKCAMSNGRCEARCSYENDITLRLRFKGTCKTATGGSVECKDDPKACAVSCELFD